MVLPAVKSQILEDLERLSPEGQQQAADLVHRLVTPTPAGTPGRELLPFVGILDAESAREMRAAIEEGCGRVDADEW